MLQIQSRPRHSAPGAPAAPPESAPPPAPTPFASARAATAANASLGVSWLNNFLQVAVVQEGQVSGTWSSPLSPEDIRDLGDLMREAVKQTGFTGTTVSVVLAHPQFIQQIIDAPPAKGAALESYIQRQVDQQKGAEGALAWVSQPRLHSKTGQGLLLSLLPESFVDQLKKEFQRAGLRLKVLIPVTAVLQEHLGKLPRSPTDTVLVVADANGLTSLLVAQPNGQIVLGRAVAGGWAQQADRVALDIKRTSLFVTQQLNQAVNSIWLFGPPSVDQMRRLQADLGTPVLPFPQELSPTVWAEAATRWPADRAPNLIPYEPEVAPRQNVVNRLVLTVAAGVAAVAIATVVLLETLARQEVKSLTRLKTQANELQTRHLELQRLTGDVVSRRQAIHELKDNRVAPVPAWFLGQIGEACPRSLLLTGSQIRREGTGWKFQLLGRLQPTQRTNTVEAGLLAKSVKEFSLRLSTSPLRAKLTEAPAVVPPPRSESGGNAFARWAQAKGLNLTAQTADQRFVLEGTLQ
jgi:hypothetical protein